jgi:hypothetical protein
MKKWLFLFLCAASTAFSLQVKGQYMTYILTNDGKYPAATNIVLGAGTALEAIRVSQPTSTGATSGTRSFAELLVPDSPGNSNFSSLGMISEGAVIVGPAIISMTLVYQNAGVFTIPKAWFTFRIIHQPDPFTPSAAVVIPSDAKGPVSILLESSTNLVDWTAALPGTYGASTQQRYFRVRAVQQ